MNRRNNQRALGVFSLALMTIVSVDSIRNLPATALFGSSLIFFFIVSAIFFLLPCALVSAELASTSKDPAGVYAWVKQAFGLQAGFLAVWFQWLENIIWYPTILSFVAGTIGYLISPSLAANKLFLMTVILCTFWGVTILNLLGIKISARFSNCCAIAGLLIPMVFIISLGIAWMTTGHVLQISFHPHALIPRLTDSSIWIALTGIILSFCGMEIAAVHTKDVTDPQRAYPKAMLIATIVIFSTLLLASLAIAIVLPEKQISLVAGIMQAFDAFFTAYHLHWILPWIAIMLILGGLGTVNNWLIALIRGLIFALRDGNVGISFCRENRFGGPTRLLIWQALIVTVISGAFLLMPSVNGSYWLLTALAAQLYMLMYGLMFAAAIRLRYKNIDKKPGFLIPGGRVGMWIIAGMGFLGSAVTFFIGFIPPSNIAVGTTLHYEILLIAGLLVMSFPPFLTYWIARRRASQQSKLLLGDPKEMEIQRVGS